MKNTNTNNAYYGEIEPNASYVASPLFPNKEVRDRCLEVMNSDLEEEYFEGLKVYKYTGELDYTMDRDYILVSRTGVVNLSEKLHKIYYNPPRYKGDKLNNHIRIKIMNGKKILFNENGNLIYGQVAPKDYRYSISSMILEDVLWDSVGLDLEFTISAEALNEVEER